MLAGSVLHTPLRLQLSNSVGLLRSCLGGWRRAIFAVSLVVMAFSVVGMHQLSLNHEFAAPTSPRASAVVAPDGGHQHGDAHDHETAGGATGPATGSLGDVASSAQHGSPVLDSPKGASDDYSEGCPDCGSHTMAFSVCLLALTLLVVSWWLTPPQVRLLPPRLAARLVILIARVGRRVPALSLAELSILRT